MAFVEPLATPGIHTAGARCKGRHGSIVGLGISVDADGFLCRQVTRTTSTPSRASSAVAPPAGSLAQQIFDASLAYGALLESEQPISVSGSRSSDWLSSSRRSLPGRASGVNHSAAYGSGPETFRQTISDLEMLKRRDVLGMNRSRSTSNAASYGESLWYNRPWGAPSDNDAYSIGYSTSLPPARTLAGASSAMPAAFAQNEVFTFDRVSPTPPRTPAASLVVPPGPYVPNLSPGWVAPPTQARTFSRPGSIRVLVGPERWPSPVNACGPANAFDGRPLGYATPPYGSLAIVDAPACAPVDAPLQFVTGPPGTIAHFFVAPPAPALPMEVGTPRGAMQAAAFGPAMCGPGVAGGLQQMKVGPLTYQQGPLMTIGQWSEVLPGLPFLDASCGGLGGGGLNPLLPTGLFQAT